MDAIFKLIEKIYEAGTDPGQWQNALVGLADATGTIDATLGGQTGARLPLLITARADPSYVHDYENHYHQRNQMQLAMRGAPVGRAVLDAMVIDRAQFSASEFYNEWCVPQGFLYGGAVNLATAQGWRASLMVSGDRELGEAALRVLQIATPHIIRAFQLNQLLQESQALSLGAFAALEHLDRGALLVSAQGTARTANGIADRILAEGDGLRLQEGRLTCLRPGDTAALEKLIGKAARGDTLPDEGTMRVARAGRSPLVVQLLPFPSSNWWSGSGQQVAMIFVTDPEARMEQVMQRLRQRYGLTRAEATLAWEIVRSGGRKDAALQRGISVATARSQLTAIFDKTGVRRQAELVRLLLDDQAEPPIKPR